MCTYLPIYLLPAYHCIRHLGAPARRSRLADVESLVDDGEVNGARVRVRPPWDLLTP